MPQSRAFGRVCVCAESSKMAMPRKSMIEFLIEKGFLTRDQANEAIKVAQQTNQPIEKAITNLNMCGEREVLQAKAQEMGIGFADLDRMTIESSALNVVPERIVKNHNAIPVRKEGQTLWVAMSRTNDVSAIDDLRIASGCRVVPVLAVKDAIDDAIRKYYGGGTVAQATADTSAAAAKPANSANFAQILAEAGVKRGSEMRTRIVRMTLRVQMLPRSSSLQAQLFSRRSQIELRTFTSSQVNEQFVFGTASTVF
jgi:type IV pilus assembly protein PilB